MMSPRLPAAVRLPAPRALAVACLAVAALSAAEAFGCPTCKDTLADGDAAAANLARGYFYSILLMLAMPFTLAGSFGLYVWREMRRVGRAQGHDGPRGIEAPASPAADIGAGLP